MLVLVVLFCVVFSFPVQALDAEISQLLDNVKAYGQQYDQGILSYLQLTVLTEISSEQLSGIIGKEVFEISGTDEGKDDRKDDFHFEGVSAESLEKYFGKPTEMTDWVWIANEERDMRVDEPLPRWETQIYRGKNIKIVLEGHPQMIKMKDGTFKPYYWAGIHSWFVEEQEDFDLGVVDKIQAMVENYYNTGQGAQELVDEIILAENSFFKYMENNQEDCEKIMDELNKGEKTESKVYQREGSLYSGERFDLVLNVHECLDCEWGWMNLDIWFQGKGMDMDFYSDMSDMDESFYTIYSTNELFRELKMELLELKLAAIFYDKSGNPDFAEKFADTRGKLSTLGMMINERVNHEDSPDRITSEERSEKIDAIFDELVDKGRKEVVKQVERKQMLFEDKEQKSGSWCESRNEWCGDGMTCERMQCVPYSGYDNGYNVENTYGNDEQNVVVDNTYEEGNNVVEENVVVDNTYEGNEQNVDGENDITGQVLGILGFAPEDYEDFGMVCEQDGDCSTGKCRLNKCSTGNGEGESCEESFWCESEICLDGNCLGGGPASQMCGNGVCDIAEYADSIYPCPQDCDVVEGCQTGCCLEEDPEGFCGGPCVICDYQTGGCVDSTAPECQAYTPSCQWGCCIEDICENGQYCNYETGNCEGSSKGCCGADDPWQYCGESNCDFNTCECEPKEEWTCMEYGCNVNQFCNGEWCECEQGWFECDGDWQNGCESQIECAGCQSDADCAASRCNGDNIETFQCVQGEGWEEMRAGFEFGTGCSFKQGRTDYFAWFNGWGENFDELNDLKMQAQSGMQDDWCERELEWGLQARAELEESFNEDFIEWYFTDIVEKNPGEFDLHMRALGGAYWSLVETNRRIAENMGCVGMEEWPEMTPIQVEWETPYGKVEIWEEFIETSYFGERMQVLTPYAKWWVFPPKEMFKEIIREEFAGGKMDEEGGPSPREREQIRQDENFMGIINSISERFGGELDLVFEISDEDESVVGLHMQINPDIIMQMNPVIDYTGERDVTLKADFDFFYDMISSMQKGQAQHTERPHWDDRPRIDEDIGGAVEGINMFMKILGGMVGGDITVDPASAWTDIIFTFREIFQLMMMGQN
jgi:hypothetical protein